MKRKRFRPAAPVCVKLPRTRSRRSQWKAKRTELVGVTVAGQQHKVPRRLLKAARLGLIDLDRR